MTAKPHWIMDELMAKIALRDLDAMTEAARLADDELVNEED